jgi:HK97 family phage major capsid protein
LAPFVDLQNLSRGRRIEGASIANVSMQSGGADGSDIPLFTTTGMVSEINSSVFVANICIEVGRDMLADSIIDIGRIIEGMLGQESQRWLDEQIGIGDGTTEPEGLTVASGIATVNADNGSGGPPTLADYYDLLFGVDKQYRTKAWNPSFISNDTTYARSRGIKIDAASPSTDQRPVFGIDATNSYMTLDFPHRIQNDIGNRVCVFGCLKKYRLYRRSGLELRIEQGGKTLARSNTVLIIARQRYAGRVVDPSAFCKWTDGQS